MIPSFQIQISKSNLTSRPRYGIMSACSGRATVEPLSYGDYHAYPIDQASPDPASSPASPASPRPPIRRNPTASPEPPDYPDRPDPQVYQDYQGCIGGWVNACVQPCSVARKRLPAVHCNVRNIFSKARRNDVTFGTM